MNDPLAFTRKDFPLLSRTIDGQPITYLDSASTTPKPQCVIDAVTQVLHGVDGERAPGRARPG